MTRTIGLLALLVFLWGGNYTWMKLAIQDIGVWSFNATRYAGATLFVAAILGASGGARALLPPRGERLRLALIGVLQVGVLSAMITLALQYIEASRTVLVIYTNPIWTLLLSIAFLGERARWNTVLGLALGFAGLAVLTNPWAMDWTGGALAGVGLALAGTIAWACAAVLYKRTTWRAGYGQQVFMQLLACMVVSIPLAVWLDWNTPVRPTQSLSLILLWNMLGPTALAYGIWALVLARVSPSTATQALLLSPLYGMLQSHIVLGEPLAPALLAAAACIVAGALLTFWRPAGQA